MAEVAEDAQVQRRLARERLAAEAIVAGQRRHAEVAEALWAAQAVVELPWWRLGAGSRRQAEEDRDEVAPEISDIGGSGAG
jgi:hypothetical protein